jgi:hypothetical protein
MSALQERIQRGIAQLDQYAPDWREKVDTQRLDMSSGKDGLLEQVFASTFYRGLVALHLQFAGGWDYGFDIQPDEDRDEEGDIQEWAELTADWKTVLGQKQEGAGDE